LINCHFSRTTWVGRPQKIRAQNDRLAVAPAGQYANQYANHLHLAHDPSQHFTTPFLQSGCSSRRPINSVEAWYIKMIIMHLGQPPRGLDSQIFTARHYAKRGICCCRVCPSVCLCVSATLRYFIKTAKRRIMQIMPHDSPLTLLFWHQSSRRTSNGITPYGGDKCRWGGLKFATFDEKCAITRKQYKIDA